MPIQFPSDDELRARFWELRKEEARIRAEAAPAREKYTELNAGIELLLIEQKAYSDEFKAIEAPLFDMCMEMSKIVALLKGQTGQPPQAGV